MGRGDGREGPFTFGADPGQRARAGRPVPGWLKAVLVLALAGGAAAGYLYLVDPELGRRVLADIPIAPPPAAKTIYKWRDADGGWQLTDHPPPAGTPYEAIEARGARNVIPSEQVTGQGTRRAQ